MKRSLWLASLAALLLACTEDNQKPAADAATGTATGGTPADGRGGTIPGAGGGMGTRDASDASAPPETGGAVAAGGVSGTGGALAPDGASATGGTAATGGVSGAGGTVVDAALDMPWGLDGAVDGAGGFDSGAGRSLDGSRQESGGDGNGPLADDASCSTLTVRAGRGPVDLLLVLDRSASMGYSLLDDCYCDAASASAGIPACRDTANCVARWTAVARAIGTTTSSTPDIRWGLKLFSSPASSDKCAVSEGVEVPVGANTAATISTTIASTLLANSTPTAAAIRAATAYLATLSDGASRAILLGTDGQPNCGGASPTVADLEGTIASISAARQAGYPVYVVGIGPSVGNLDAFAIAGGTSYFYPASSTAELTAALGSISAGLGTCGFRLDVLPPDANEVGVYLDGLLVPKDPVSGWSLDTDPQTITFHGDSCDAILAGAAVDVRAVFVCPGGSLPPFLY